MTGEERVEGVVRVETEGDGGGTGGKIVRFWSSSE